MRRHRIEDYALPEKVDQLKRLLRWRSLASALMLTLSLVFCLLSFALNADTQSLLEDIQMLHEIRLEPAVRSYAI